MAEENVGVKAIAHHADLVTLELEGVRDVREHELGGLAYDDRLLLRRACNTVAG